MLFRQLYDAKSSTYSYLLAARAGGEALMIDPVLDQLDSYLRLLDELQLKLMVAIDTHTHADHITALGALRQQTGCETRIGAQAQAECVSAHFEDGETIAIDGVQMQALHTPGHTDDSYSFVMADRVFTGDSLLIRGTGRTDFQNGDAHQAYDSLFKRLLQLPDQTLVYPGHDYKGWTVSTIAEERMHNPRLQVNSADEYAKLMGQLNLPDPKMMDVAVSANRQCGRLPD